MRGMAVDETLRKRGVGAALLSEVDRIVAASDFSNQNWCNARLVAKGFYERHGWRGGERTLRHPHGRAAPCHEQAVDGATPWTISRSPLDTTRSRRDGLAMRIAVLMQVCDSDRTIAPAALSSLLASLGKAATRVELFVVDDASRRPMP